MLTHQLHLQQFTVYILIQLADRSQHVARLLFTNNGITVNRETKKELLFVEKSAGK